MKRTILISALLFLFTSLSAQKISNVDFDAIRKSLDGDPKLYARLTERFRAGDSSLTYDEYRIIYYGQCFQKGYNPYGSDSKNSDAFTKKYLAKEFDKALPYALKMIENNPMDMRMTFKALVCYHQLKDEAGIAKMKSRYNGIISTIFESGDGKSDSTAFVVMCVSDEYELMANMDVEMTSQALVGSCDLMTLKKNDLGLKELYFNVSKPLQSMMDMFKK